jgi:hypothetical protein
MRATVPSEEGARVERDSSGNAAMLDAAERTEREFLSMCVAQGSVGHGYLRRATDEHLSTDTLRRARDWLDSHFDSPLAGLPADDPTLGATVTGLVPLAEGEQVSEQVLEIMFVQLDQSRVERAIRRAVREDQVERQSELVAEKRRLAEQINELMGREA